MTTIRKQGWNVLFIVGLCLFVRGCWHWWHPAAFLASGTMLAVIGFAGGIDAARQPRNDE